MNDKKYIKLFLSCWDAATFRTAAAHKLKIRELRQEVLLTPFVVSLPAAR
jgi:hypothetical protein